MSDHDPMCLSQEFLPADLIRFCDCKRVRAIRADEKAQHLSIPIVTRATMELATPMICALLLDDVRAKVDALREPDDAWKSDAYNAAIDDVLALLDGARNG